MILASPHRRHKVACVWRGGLCVYPLWVISRVLTRLLQIDGCTSSDIHWIVHLLPFDKGWGTFEWSGGHPRCLRNLLRVELQAHNIAGTSRASGSLGSRPIDSWLLVRGRAYSRIGNRVQRNVLWTVDHGEPLLLVLNTLSRHEALSRRSCSRGWLVRTLGRLVSTRDLKAALKMFSIFHYCCRWILWLLGDASTDTPHRWWERCHLVICHVGGYLLGSLVGEIERSMRARVLISLPVLVFHRAV